MQAQEKPSKFGCATSLLQSLKFKGTDKMSF